MNSTHNVFALLCSAPLRSVFCSGSMEPAFQRGDILFLTNYNDPIRVGEIVVFKIKDRDIPIVHRVLKVHENNNGEVRAVLCCAVISCAML